MNPVYEKLVNCYNSVREKIDFVPDVAIVLGSGLGDYGKEIKVVAEFCIIPSLEPTPSIQTLGYGTSQPPDLSVIALDRIFNLPSTNVSIPIMTCGSVLEY